MTICTSIISKRVSAASACGLHARVAQQFVEAVAADLAGKPLSSQTLRHIKWLGVSVFDHAKNADAFPDHFENPFFRVKIPKTKYVASPRDTPRSTRCWT